MRAARSREIHATPRRLRTPAIEERGAPDLYVTTAEAAILAGVAASRLSSRTSAAR